MNTALSCLRSLTTHAAGKSKSIACFQELHLSQASSNCKLVGFCICVCTALSCGLWCTDDSKQHCSNLYSLCSLSMPCYLVFHENICPFRGFTGGQKNEDVKQDKDDVLNIFSVASGHLYERFLRWVRNLSSGVSNGECALLFTSKKITICKNI